MRFLILALVAYIAAVVSFWPQRRAALEADADKTAEPEDGGFPERLAEAAATLHAASKAGDTSPDLSASLVILADQCAELSERAAADEGFARRNRASILRLLLPLYGVAQRSSLLAAQDRTPEAEAMLTSASDLISRAAEALKNTASRADASMLRHLEADLEILEDRLPSTPPPPA